MVFTACMRAEHSGHTCNMEQNQAGPSEELTCADATPVCPPECILLGTSGRQPPPSQSLTVLCTRHAGSTTELVTLCCVLLILLLVSISVLSSKASSRKGSSEVPVQSVFKKF